VRREIHRNGRNRVYIDDQPATVRLLADLAPFLLRIHGQREELGLVEPDLQRAWLDRSGGPEAAKLLERTGEAYDRWHRVAERLAAVTGYAQVRDERLDLLRFQAREIDAAQLRAGEDDELREERGLLRNAEAIGEALGVSAEVLFDEEGSAVDRLARSEALLEGIEERPEMEQVYAELVPRWEETKEEALRARSAILWPEELHAETPILLLHGTADWRVDPTQALRMATALYEAKRPFRLVLFEGGDHGLSEHRAEVDRLARDWLDRYVRDREPWPSLEPHGR
jgi:DNA repair ATPase RecN